MKKYRLLGVLKMLEKRQHRWHEHTHQVDAYLTVVVNHLMKVIRINYSATILLGFTLFFYRFTLLATTFAIHRFNLL